MAFIFTSARILNWVQQGTAIARQAYPQNLAMELSATSGVVTNSTGPVFFPLSAFGGKKVIIVDEDMKNQTGATMEDMEARSDKKRDDFGGVENLMVIDTLATPTQIDSYNTIALLTKDALVIKGGNKAETKLFALKDVLKDAPGSINITSGVVEEKITALGNAIVNNKSSIMGTTYAMIAVFGLIGAVIGSFFIGLFTALALYLYAIGLWLLSKAMGKNYTYMQSYSFAAAGFVLPFLFVAASWWFKLAILCLIVGRIWYLQSKKLDHDAHTVATVIDAEEEEAVETVAHIIEEGEEETK